MSKLETKFPSLFTSEALEVNKEVLFINQVSESKTNPDNISVNIFATYAKPYEASARSSRGVDLEFIQLAGFTGVSRPNIKTGFVAIAKTSELGKLVLNAKEGDSFTAILESLGMKNYVLSVWEVTESEYEALTASDKGHFTGNGTRALEPKIDPTTDEQLQLDGEKIYTTAIFEKAGNDSIYVKFNQRVAVNALVGNGRLKA